MTVYRTVYTVEVFSQGPFEVPEETDWLAEINYAITDGPCIGNVDHVSTEIVPADKVGAEMHRIGNDGSFFDDVAGNAT